MVPGAIAISLKKSHVFSNPTPEGYGWGFWGSRSGDRVWIAISSVGDGQEDGAAQWVVSVEQVGALYAIKSMLHKPDSATLADLGHCVKCALDGHSALKIRDSRMQLSVVPYKTGLLKRYFRGCHWGGAGLGVQVSAGSGRQ